MALKLHCEIGNHEMGNLEEHRVVENKYSCVKCAIPAKITIPVSSKVHEIILSDFDSVLKSFGFTNNHSLHPHWSGFYLSPNRRYCITATDITWALRTYNGQWYGGTIKISDIDTTCGVSVLTRLLDEYKAKNLL